MKVSELISILQEVDQERVVIMSEDGEGNSYLPLDGINAEDYLYDNEEERLVDLEEEREDWLDYNENEFEGMSDVAINDLWVAELEERKLEPCLVFWPVG